MSPAAFVYPETPILNQPAVLQTRSEQRVAGVRRPIPVSTISWRSTEAGQANPLSGLDFLHGVDQVHIQQTVELHDLVSKVESENRYTIKIPMGETLYVACENSKPSHRMLWGSARPFSMRLLDQSQQEAFSFQRRLACNAICCGLRSEELEVWAPPGDYLGRVNREFTMFDPLFRICDASGELLFWIVGPHMGLFCTKTSDAEFSILSADRTTPRGSIRHMWDHHVTSYNLITFFPSQYTDCRTKALILGAAFLLEYIFFENSKSGGIC
uniref:Phospholipid scramblase n=1 Tax=Xenopsylla cheopis TaxID=163159 RepID=A0A6M2DJK1_XENCH